jgi:uncharacterized protein (TIGR03437 family)
MPPIKAVVNAASYIGGPVSPGERVVIFGTTIGGVQVLFSGIPAPMI